MPLFWIKKLNLRPHPKELGKVWIDLVKRIQKGSDLEKKVTECLMKWYQKHQSWADDGMTPIHIAASLGYPNIFMFAASYSENINAPNTHGFTPLNTAIEFGSTEIFKFLAPQLENPNDRTPRGWTPLKLAINIEELKFSHFWQLKLKIVIFLIPVGLLFFKLQLSLGVLKFSNS